MSAERSRSSSVAVRGAVVSVGVASLVLAGCAAGVDGEPEESQGDVEAAATSGLIGAATALDVTYPYNTWVATYRGATAGQVNVAVTLRGVEPHSDEEFIRYDGAKIYYDDCATMWSGDNASFLGEGCRQQTLESPWWGVDVGQRDFEWREDVSGAGPNTVFMRAKLAGSQPQMLSLQAINLLSAPLSVELPVRVPTGETVVCTSTSFFSMFQELVMVNEQDLAAQKSAPRKFKATLRGRSVDGAFIVNVSSTDNKNIKAAGFNWTAGDRVEILGLGGEARLSGCGGGDTSTMPSGLCFGGDIGFESVFSLYDGVVSSKYKLRIADQKGHSYVASIEPLLIPDDTQLSCGIGTTSCARGQAGVTCAGGAFSDGTPLPVGETYCGQPICGQGATPDGALYVCGASGWEEVGQACGFM